MNCAHCGTAINWELAFISGHGLADLCGGTGKTVRVDRSIFRIAPDPNRHPAPTGGFYIRDGQDVASQLAN
jgi:hypothetical protein